MYCDWPILRRCCFCLPLRRGVLLFSYLNILFSGFMIGIYSYNINYERHLELVYHGIVSSFPSEMCILLYCLEIIFNVLLLYGAHKKIILYVKIYYYFAISTTLCSIMMGLMELTTIRISSMIMEIFIFGFTGLTLQLYLIILVSSLLKKLVEDGPHIYENPLQQFINGQIKVETNGVYNPSTVPNDASIMNV